jgi:hypothetical protein
LLEVVIGIDPERDRRELERLGISKFSIDYVRTTLAARYEAARLKVKEVGLLDKGEWTRLHSSWARRLSPNDAREVVYFIAEAQK